MSVAIHLIEADTPSRRDLAERMAARGAHVTVSPPAAEPVIAAGTDAAVFLCREDPFEPGGVPATGVVAGWAKAASDVDARFILCSTVLLYADGGEAELMANDPEMEPVPEVEPLREAELELFGSSAEVMLLRLGILIGPGGTATEELVRSIRAGNLPIPDDGHDRFLSLLDRDTLAAALVEVAPSSLHGGWDLVADDVRLEELLEFTAAELGAPKPVRVSAEQAMAAAGSAAATRWLTSRKVTGRDLRETGAAGARSWREVVAEALP